MKKYFLVYFLLLTIFSKAQTIHFANPGNYWVTTNINGDGQRSVQDYWYDTAVVISGNTYLPLRVRFDGCCTNLCGGIVLDSAYFIREDTITGFVYFRNYNFDTFEHVLYNYNLQLNDIMVLSHDTLFCNSVVDTDSVVVFDSTLILGRSYKAYNFFNTFFGPDKSYVVLQGIGCINNPVFPAVVCHAIGEYGEQLICFSQDGIAPVFSLDTFPILGAPANLFSMINHCALGVSTVIHKSKDLTILPNPATDQITISNAEDTRVYFNDMMGKEVMQLNITNSKQSIDISQLSSGIYIVTSLDPITREKQVKKIWKE